MKGSKAYLVRLALAFALWPLAGAAGAAVCDVDTDLDVDIVDIGLISQSRNAPATGADDPRDVDGDGVITLLDVRTCQRHCTLPRCAIPGPDDIDNDLDGFSENQGDCDDANPDIFPGATEIPGNGIDEDCDGVDEEIPTPAPSVSTVPGIEFGTVSEGNRVSRLLTIENIGDADLIVDALLIDDPAFSAEPAPGFSLPLVIEPGESANLVVSLAHPLVGDGSIVPYSGRLSIVSNDPDRAVLVVELSGTGIPELSVETNPVVGAQVDGIITLANCGRVTGFVEFTSVSSGAETFVVRLIDSGNVVATSDPLTSSDGAGVVGFSAIDACGLADGIIQVVVDLTADGSSFATFIGTPAVKNTDLLPAPLLDPLPAVTAEEIIEVCGGSRENTTVRIEGGAIPVSVQLGSGEDRFCVDVTLRRNTENRLLASAIDDLRAPPKPIAYAQPVSVVHLYPDDFIIAEVSSRPLSEAEIADLVDRGIIDLDDPANFNVSMFTVVLTIGGFPVTISQPVAVPVGPGIGYGGSGSGGGWLPIGGGGGGGNPGGGCTRYCAQIVVVNPGTGESGAVIPGVIIVDGRIKTLKEFFQVTLALYNTSENFLLTDVGAEISLPAGLTALRAGPGSDIAAISTDSGTNSVAIGEIDSESRGIAQFVVRGDAIGTHEVEVAFFGSISGGGLPASVPFAGAAGTSLVVSGPPRLQVVVRHPSDPAGPDVTLGEIYDLLVEITNLSDRPALYTSLELFVGGGAELVDENGDTIPDSSLLRTIGSIPPGRTARLAYRVRSLLEGEIIACQAIAAANISLGVDTGPDGTSCQVNNMYPANFVPLPAEMPPTVIGINPLNNAAEVPLTTSVVAVFTPPSACLVADSWQNVVTAAIGGDPANGFEIISADLASAGTIYLEELNAIGEPVRHIPTDLTLENPPAGGTTIAVLRLGLASPLSQAFLRPNTQYRVTLVGGIDGICNAPNTATMAENFSWVFRTAQDCSITGDLQLLGISPADGAVDRPLDQAVDLQFNNRLNPASFRFVPGDPGASSFGVYLGAEVGNGDITAEGGVVVGSGTFGSLNNSLIYTPSAELPAGAEVTIRLTDGIRDVCGNALQTGTANGVILSSFQTQLPDTTPPDAPEVNPVPVLTSADTIEISGVAEPGATVTADCGAGPEAIRSNPDGNFNLDVLLIPDELNVCAVQATDDAGNTSLPATQDINGDPLQTLQDGTPPTVVAVDPADGAADVPVTAVVSVTFSEAIGSLAAGSIRLLDGAVDIPIDIGFAGDTLTLTPSGPLTFAAMVTLQIDALAVSDAAGNGNADSFTAQFTTEPANNVPVAVIVAPATVVVGELVQLDGGNSFDADPADVLTYQWVLTPPAGSSAVLSDANAVDPTFTADIVGAYQVELTVSDGKDDSAPDSEPIQASLNSPPVADAGPDRSVTVGQVVTLDGSGSSDANGHPLTYRWSLETPLGSAATLSDATAESTEFIADVPGEYVVTLVVNDGFVDSDPDPVTITAVPPSLACGTVVSGSIDAVGEESLYSFAGSANDLIILTLTQTAGFPSLAQFTLFAPSGAQVGSTQNANSQVNFTLTETGTHTIRVRARNLVDTGSFNLGIECLSPLAAADNSIVPGQVLSDSIDSPADTDLVTFDGAAAEQVQITLTQTAGFPALAQFTLYAPSGVPVGSTQNANSQVSFTLTETGTHVIRVRARNLVDTGNYNLGLD